MQTTFAIIKPDATLRNLNGKILSRYEEEGFEVVGMKMKSLSRKEAEGFYAEHSERPFFGELVAYMCSAPLVLLALRAENAVMKNRDLMGATNPGEAAEGTLRKLFGKNIGENSVHGSDSAESAARELSYFFADSELS